MPTFPAARRVGCQLACLEFEAKAWRGAQGDGIEGLVETKVPDMASVQADRGASSATRGGDRPETPADQGLVRAALVDRQDRASGCRSGAGGRDLMPCARARSLSRGLRCAGPAQRGPPDVPQGVPDTRAEQGQVSRASYAAALSSKPHDQADPGVSEIERAVELGEVAGRPSSGRPHSQTTSPNKSSKSSGSA